MPLEITEGEVWDVVIDRPFQDMAMKKKNMAPSLSAFHQPRML